jgi:hypothetical protein
MGKTNPHELLKRMAKSGLHPCQAQTTHKTACRIKLKKADRCKYHRGKPPMSAPHRHHASYKEQMKHTRGLDKLAAARLKKGLAVGSSYKPKSS